MNSRMASFAVGILICDVFANIKFQLPNFFYFTMASIGWILANYFPNAPENISLFGFHSIKSFYPIILSSLIIYGSLKSNFLNSVLQAQPLIYAGKISFSMYLLHLPIFCSFSCTFLQHLLNQNIEFPIANDITLILSVLILLITSHFFCIYIDQGAIKASKWIQNYFIPFIRPN